MSMDTKSLADAFRNAPTATSFSGLSMICANSSGELLKPLIRTILQILYMTGEDIVDMDEATTPGIWSTGAATIASKLPATTGWNACLVEIFKRGSYTMQRLTNPSGAIAVRVKGQSGWGPYRIYQYTTA